MLVPGTGFAFYLRLRLYLRLRCEACVCVYVLRSVSSTPRSPQAALCLSMMADSGDETHTLLQRLDSEDFDHAKIAGWVKDYLNRVRALLVQRKRQPPLPKRSRVTHQAKTPKRQNDAPY